VSLADYIPHAAVGALATVVAYVFQDHTKRDDKRFGYMNDAVNKSTEARDADFAALNLKVDRHYEELTRLLMDRLPPRL
jgi:hypothetical protein